MKLLPQSLILLLNISVLFCAEPKQSSPGAQPLPDPPGIHNLYVLGTNIYSGSTPESAAGFHALTNLGVKTIISVDGAKPDVTLAKQFGLRYIHLPHGYDGISTELQLTLSKAAVELSGPIFIHCHHGKHRGPTAAAILCMTKNAWTTAQAGQWLHAAGTSTNYSGLYKTIRDFKKPSAEQLAAVPSHFPETAQVSGLVEAMVAIDHTWENLKAIRAAGYQSPKSHPDLIPSNEAVLLWEHYRESQRLADSAQQGSDFLPLLRKAEAEAQSAAQLLRQHSANPSVDLRDRLDKAFGALSQSCTSCHRQFRDK